ncbi:CHC2-type zinc finger protein [Winogradskyella pacifica]|uniref:CHC2-type zinc finger protein n=1 Tax=Winogradskyella pacifica TaxID=664642 RepID=A0A3D9LM75_9FLAO|nr:toprim domain-containing protein [Winogradskyella pacifica]REE08531.1 CHC2-type zinc finger protein [Winogradskyella pacifica]
MKRKINCERARTFSIEKALAKLGHFPEKTAEKEAWFLSPFRSETQASFKVSKTRNRWYDHGEGVGGNVIDLVCRILKCSIKEALEFLSENIATKSLLLDEISNEEVSCIVVTSVKKITHPALIQYLNSRGVPLGIAKFYCKEVWYTFNNSKFFAIGLRNNKDGWELRNKIFKNSCSPKFYTYLQRNKCQLIMLEGMFDLLSLAVLNETLLKDSDVLILNSISFIKQIETRILNYQAVHLYLDCDSAGQNAAQYLTTKYSHVKDKSDFYKNHKDLNEFLCHEKRRNH